MPTASTCSITATAPARAFGTVSAARQILSSPANTLSYPATGWCGKGVSLRAKGLGAKVIVTETDPIRALEAVMDGYEVMPMKEAAKIGDIFCTVTGGRDIITAEHFPLMKDGAILSNAGHFNVEVDMAALEKMAVKKYEARHNIQGYVMPTEELFSP